MGARLVQASCPLAEECNRFASLYATSAPKSAGHQLEFTDVRAAAALANPMRNRPLR